MSNIYHPVDFSFPVSFPLSPLLLSCSGIQGYTDRYTGTLFFLADGQGCLKTSQIVYGFLNLLQLVFFPRRPKFIFDLVPVPPPTTSSCRRARRFGRHTTKFLCALPSCYSVYRRMILLFSIHPKRTEGLSPFMSLLSYFVLTSAFPFRPSGCIRWKPQGSGTRLFIFVRVPTRCVARYSLSSPPVAFLAPSSTFLLRESFAIGESNLVDFTF